jgi:hypothetical protein
VEFAYNPHDPYHFGDADVPGSTPQLPPGSDAVLRVYGVMRPLRADDWAFNGSMPWIRSLWPRVDASADTVGVGSVRTGIDWERVEYEKDSFDYHIVDEEVTYLSNVGQSGSHILGQLLYCPDWASSCSSIQIVEDRAETTWSNRCAPVNLFVPDTCDSNYWARYVRHTLDSFPDIHCWSTWNEPNLRNRFWQRSNYYYDVDQSAWDACSLYVQLCKVTYRTIKSHPDRAGDTVVVGSMSAVNDDGDGRWASGKDWLRMMYELAGDSCWWDVVSVHPYQEIAGSPTFFPFQEDLFAADAETMRAVMRQNGDYRPLWATELGWYVGRGDPDSTKLQGNNLCKTMTSAAASRALPGGGFERLYWYSFIDYVDSMGLLWPHESLADTTLRCRPRLSAYSSGHTHDALVGKRYNGQVLTGEPAIDAELYTYEFEDPATDRKTWVAWREGSGAPTGYDFPCRVDQPDSMMLAYDADEEAGPVTADVSGWLPLSVGTRPVFVTEPATRAVARPDLVVDSLRVVPDQPQVYHPMDLIAYVRNADTTRGTPGQVTVQFRSNDSLLFSVLTPDSMGPGAIETVHVVISSVPWALRGNRLLSVVVNPGQEYVEKTGTDDNVGYARVLIRIPPQGNVAPVLGGGRSCVPRVLFNLSSISFENDSLPCESLQLLQAHYGISDTAPDTIIASGWFGAKTCTTWQFLAGEGHYRFACLSSDSGGNISDTTWHDTTFVTFDSTPPAVSVAVNSGDAFANDASVLVSWAGVDSLSPACSVRLGNAALVNVVAGSGFGTADTLWRYSDAQADAPSGMVSLPMGEQDAAVWQMLPLSTCESLIGRKVRLFGRCSGGVGHGVRCHRLRRVRLRLRVGDHAVR